METLPRLRRLNFAVSLGFLRNKSKRAARNAMGQARGIFTLAAIVRLHGATTWRLQGPDLIPLALTYFVVAAVTPAPE
jgi:hypothetical protein